MAEEFKQNASFGGPMKVRRTGRTFIFLLFTATCLGASYFRYPEFFERSSFSAPGLGPRLANPSAKAPQQAVVPPSFDVAYAQPGGEFVAAGRAQPNWVVRLHSNGKPLGETKADSNGEWVFTPQQPLKPGQHSLSLTETSPEGQGSVEGTRVIALSLAPKPESSAMAKASKPTMAGAEMNKAPIAQADAKPIGNAGESAKDCDVAVVQRGDTLWALSERCYGAGAHYSRIYESNRSAIRDPDLIYPDQRFIVPRQGSGKDR